MKKDTVWLMERAPVSRAVCSLVLPTMLGMLVQLVYNLTDTFFVGLLDDYVQLAAVSLTLPVVMVLGGLGQLFSAGVPALLSRLLGEGKTQQARRASATVFYVALGTGLVASLGILGALEPVLAGLSATGETYLPTRQYLSIVVAGTVFSQAQGLLQSLLRSQGISKPAAWGSALGVLVNLVLDPLMIFALGMGVSGAAVATVIGNLVSLGYFVVKIRRASEALSLSWRDFRFRSAGWRELLGIGVPSFLGQALMGFAMLFANGICMGYSTQMVTASNVAGKAYTVVVMLSMGVSMGVQPFLGYQRGKGDWHRMRQGVLWAMGMGTALCLAACVFLLLGGGWFIRLFSSEPLVVEIGERCVRAFLLSTPFLGISMVLLSYLQASGKMFRGMLVSLSRQFLAFFPLLILLNSFFGLDGMIYVQPLSDLVTTALAVAFSLPSLLGKWPVLSHSSPCAL